MSDITPRLFHSVTHEQLVSQDPQNTAVQSVGSSAAQGSLQGQFYLLEERAA